MSDGLFSIKERKKHDPVSSQLNKLNSSKNKFNPYRYISPNIITNSSNDHVIMHNTKQNLKKYDKHLKKFNATKALDAALEVRQKSLPEKKKHLILSLKIV